MGCETAGNIRIQTVKARWEIEEAFCLKLKGIVSTDLEGKFLNFSTGGTKYYLWFDQSGSASDPTPAGRTGIEVDVSAASSVALILAAIETAVEAATGYEGVIDGTDIRFDLDTTDEVLDAAVDVDTGIIVSNISQGGNIDLGLLDGDVVPALSETLLDVVAHQTGATVLAQLRQGLGVVLPLVLKEFTKDLYQQLITAAGDKFTPPAGTELYGWGTSKLGANTVKNSRRLVLHPFNKPDSDKSEDITVWLAYPNVESITYSGENPQTMNVNFTAFVDDRRPKEINILAFGDSSQAGILE